jgi:hypothetical protein
MRRAAMAFAQGPTRVSQERQLEEQAMSASYSHRAFRAIAALSCAGFASVSLAQTVDPNCVVGPPVWRGQPLSVWAQFEFGTQPDNFFLIQPNILQTVGGSGGETLFDGFQTHAEVDSLSNWSWVPLDDNTDGGMQAGASGGQIAFKVHNWIDEEPVKWVRLQIEFTGSAPPVVSTVEGYVAGSTDPLPGTITLDPVFTSPGTFFMDWEILPNPDWDLVVLDLAPGVVLDRICIDTISLPTPGGAAVLGLAGLVVAFRRR